MTPSKGRYHSQCALSPWAVGSRLASRDVDGGIVHHAEVRLRIGVRVGIHVLSCLAEVGEANSSEVLVEDLPDVTGGKLLRGTTCAVVVGTEPRRRSGRGSPGWRWREARRKRRRTSSGRGTA